MLNIPGLDIPGYTVVRFGIPKQGETFVSGAGSVMCCEGVISGQPRLILEKDFEWPVWFKAKYIAMDEDETWFAYMKEPEADDDCWYAGCDYLNLSDCEYFDLKLPTCSDWTKSLRKNPHAK